MPELRRGTVALGRLKNKFESPLDKNIYFIPGVTVKLHVVHQECNPEVTGPGRDFYKLLKL
jgi:hypothetical protein